MAYIMEKSQIRNSCNLTKKRLILSRRVKPIMNITSSNLNSPPMKAATLYAEISDNFSGSGMNGRQPPINPRIATIKGNFSNLRKPAWQLKRKMLIKTVITV